VESPSMAEVGPPVILSLDVAGYFSVIGLRQRWGVTGESKLRSLTGIGRPGQCARSRGNASPFLFTPGVRRIAGVDHA
jgi:hypothetical protein